MRKLILAFIMILSCAVCFTACDGLGEKYWEDTSALADKVFVSSEFDSVYNIDFCSNLDTIMTQGYGASYFELKDVLSPLFEASIYYSYNHYKDLLIVPKNQSGDFKNKIKAVNKNIQEFEEALQVFNQKKTEYEVFITFTDDAEANSDLELARLLKFKREYITVIESAYNLSESIFEARRVGYYDFSDYSASGNLVDDQADCSLAVNASSLKIAKSAIQITRAYNAKEMASEYENYWIQAKAFHTSVVKQFENGAFTIPADVKDRLLTWRGVYDMFESDSNTFNDIIKKIDLKKLSKCNYDTKAYALLTGNEQDEIYANYFLNFYEEVALLYSYTIAIFA